MKELIEIQTRLNAPKNQRNNFGKYNYRNCEDILMALKPLMKQQNCTLIIGDEIELIGDRFYIKATATIKNEKGDSESATAYARECENKKGMDSAQLTGATSSYARKYALNGLFAIDDNKDADSINPADNEPQAKAPDLITDAQLKKINTLITNLGKDRDVIKEYYKVTSLKDLWKTTAIELINTLEKSIPKE